MLPIVLFIFLCVGIFASHRRRNSLGTFALSALILVPITNSALTTGVNAAHRLAPLIPISIILIALGFDWLFSNVAQLRNVSLRSLLAIGLWIMAVAPVGSGLARFFLAGYANDGMYRRNVMTLYQDFLVRHLITLIRERHYPSACLIGSRENVAYFQLLHVREVFSYFLPGISLSSVGIDFPHDHTVALVRTCPSPIRFPGELPAIKI